MDHKLIKELKDAGFPQGETEKGVVMDNDFQEVVSKETHSYVPTLSELIEACGDNFDLLTKEKVLNEKWLASGNVMPGFLGEGKTPSEAVARLYIALNKKQ